MVRRARLSVVAFFGCALSLSAQEAQRPSVLMLGQPVGSNRTIAFSALNGSYYSSQAPTLLDGRLISLSNAFTWIEATPPDFLPAASAKELPRVSTARARRDLDNKAVDVRPKLFDYAGGEVGVSYGRSTGSSGIELKQGYIFGETGNDKTQISVGVFYEEVNGR